MFDVLSFFDTQTRTATTAARGGRTRGREVTNMTNRDGRPRRDSARPLAALVLALGVVAALAGPVLAVYQLTQPGGAVAVMVTDTSVLGDPTPDGLPEGTRLDLAGALDTVDLEVAALPAGLRLLTRLDDLVAGAVLFAGALILRNILADVGRGQPFHPRMPGRIAGLAVVVVVGALFPGLAGTLATVVVLESIDGFGGASPLGFVIGELSLLPFVVAGALAIASRVFRQGQQLTDELEGLV